MRQRRQITLTEGRVEGLLRLFRRDALDLHHDDSDSRFGGYEVSPPEVRVGADSDAPVLQPCLSTTGAVRLVRRVLSAPASLHCVHINGDFPSIGGRKLLLD